MNLDLTRLALAAALLASLAACGGTRTAESELRKTLDDLNAIEPSKFRDVTGDVLRFIPLGSPEKKAVDTLLAAGLPQTRRFNDTPTDRRCPSAVAGLPCLGPKSDYYLFHDVIVEQTILFWKTYDVQIGVRDGIVDFVFAVIDVHNRFP
jgi:hypothetical protein